MRQAGDLVLEQVVADAQAHDVHGGRFANGTRQQHERRMLGQPAHKLPDVEGGKAWQVVVGQDQVEILRLQRRFGGLKTVHCREQTGQLTALETQACQSLIGGRVFNMKDLHTLFLRLLIAKGAIIRYILEHGKQ